MRRKPRLLTTIATALVTISLLGGCGAAASNSGGTAGSGTGQPKVGGSVTVGAYNATALDPDNSAFAAGPGQSNVGFLVYGVLFTSPAKGTKLVPDLATGYSYNKDATQLTISLRHGQKFQDGTAFNASAVLWNLKRHDQPTTTSYTYFSSVTSMTAPDPYTVVIKFSKPDGIFVSDLASLQVGWMGSPTAFNKLGAQQYNIRPVGAGPYQITSDTPGQRVVLQRWPGYWDAQHVYLSTITFTNTGTDPTSQYDDLQSGALTYVGFNGATTPPSLLQQAKSNPSFELQPGLDLGSYQVSFNSHVAPFNNKLAREAIAYCTDRESITENTDQGFATPEYILAGPGSYYTSGTASGKTVSGWQYGKTLNPYTYDPAKAKALVQQLGGLTFTLDTIVGLTAGSANVVALQQEWTQCGIQAKIGQIQLANSLPIARSGAFQATYGSYGIFQDPSLNVIPITYGSPINNTAAGWNIPSIQNLIKKTQQVTTTAEESDLWHQIWQGMNENVTYVPIFSAPYYYYSSKCLHGANFTAASGNQALLHAYYAC